MITRKIAKELINNWHEYVNNIYKRHGLSSSKRDPLFDNHLNMFIHQFSDELTPDEMLNKMREWAKNNNCELTIHEVVNDELTSYEIDFQLFDFIKFDKYEVVHENDSDRNEVIIKAYNRFKYLNDYYTKPQIEKDKI